MNELLQPRRAMSVMRERFVKKHMKKQGTPHWHALS